MPSTPAPESKLCKLESCQKVFAPKREWQKFCQDSCRDAWYAEQYAKVKANG